MSFKYYTNWWIKNKRDLENLTEKDKAFLNIPEKVKERSLANKLVGGMYARYCILVQQLDLCLDQMAQPQKTGAIRKLVESAVMRLKELYNELTWIDFSEYHYIDDTLVELKLIPHEIEIIHPYLSFPRPYDVQQMYERFKSGERIYTPPALPSEQDQITEATAGETASQPLAESTELEEEKKSKKARPQPPLLLDEKPAPTRKELEKEKKEARLEEAIILIQIYERSRQARLYHGGVYATYLKLKKGDVHEQTERTEEEKEEAAIKIQKVFRGHFCRRRLKFREEKRRFLIGMTESSKKSKVEFEKEEEAIEARRRLRELRIKQYIDANLAEKERVLRVVQPGLMEDISDEIREWFYQWYIRARTFDKFPPEEKGGTILVVRGETLSPEEWIDQVEKKRREKVLAGGDKAAKEKLKAEKAKKKAAEKAVKKAQKAALKKALKEKKKRRMDVANYQMEFDNPGGTELYEDGMKEHNLIWDFRDELLNPQETHYMDLITDQRCYEVQLESRVIVDEMMRLELEFLNCALAKDRGKKPKKPKKPKRKRKGKKKKKQPKDMTSDRSMEDLFQELVDNGIIRMYPKTHLDEFIGDFSYNNFEMRNEFLDPPPCLADIRQAIVMNCIMPLGLEVCKGRVRSMIIGGPPLCGKKILANAIFTATRCVLFDLSPHVLAGKYPEKSGMTMLIHLLLKMGRLLQPSIFYVEGAEKNFYKKVPKDEKPLEPKRLGKVLLKKIVKAIKPDDRIMLLGITNTPWAANAKMKKVYEKVILIPRSDYGSVHLFWRQQLMSFHGVDRNIDLSCLTKLTVKYPLGTIKQVIDKVLNPDRIVKLRQNPLKQEELFEPFTTINPIADKIWKKYVKWYNKTVIGKLGKKFAKQKKLLREDLLKKREAEDKKGKKQKK